jgi:hypothetical protein
MFHSGFVVQFLIEERPEWSMSSLWVWREKFNTEIYFGDSIEVLLTNRVLAG